MDLMKLIAHVHHGSALTFNGVRCPLAAGFLMVLINYDFVSGAFRRPALLLLPAVQMCIFELHSQHENCFPLLAASQWKLR